MKTDKEKPFELGQRVYDEAWGWGSVVEKNEWSYMMYYKVIFEDGSFQFFTKNKKRYGVFFW